MGTLPIRVRVLGPTIPREGLEALLQKIPELLLVEMSPQVRVVTGSDWTQYLEGQCRSRLVLLVGSAEPNLAAAVRRGTEAFVCETEPVTGLVEAIHATARGDSYCSPVLTRTLLHALRGSGVEEGDKPDPLAACARLSERQREVALLAADGLTNDEIAAIVCRSVSTVKFHLGHALKKLGVPNRTGLNRFLPQLRCTSADPAKRERE